MSKDHFTLEPSEYVRDLDIPRAWLADTTLYMHKCTGQPLDFCRSFAIAQVSPTGPTPMQNPKIKFLASETKGNRQPYVGNLLDYINYAVAGKRPMAPNMTIYKPISEERSITAIYIDGNVKQRSEFKHAQFDAEQRGQTALMQLFKNLQTTCKIKNNSVSGAHASPYNPFYCKSSHSSLTSTCRISTSYANASNERFIRGNRHFWCPDVIIASILTTIRLTNYALLEECVLKYDIVLPSVRDVMECIEYSSNNYWRDEIRMGRIEVFVGTLTPLERAAFVYSGDLYHIAKHNPEVVRNFLLAMAQHVHDVSPQSAGFYDKADGDLKILSTMICSDIIDRKPFKDFRQDEHDKFRLVESTIYNMQAVLDDHELFIKALLRPPSLPPSIFNVPYIRRRAVPTSDTDSTIFTTQYWTKWITGSINFDKISSNIRDTITFVVSKMVKHNLAMMSANLGIDDANRNTIQMKNEYGFPLFALTAIAKHYLSFMDSQEGFMLKKEKYDVKGVNLRSSNAPAEVTHVLHAWQQWVLNKYRREGSVSIDDIFAPVAQMENDIIADIRQGGLRFMRTARINDAASYKKGDDATPLQYARFWDDVYSSKYGAAPPRPYGTVKISLNLGNKTSVKAWIAGIKDRVIADKIEEFMRVNGKDKLPSMQLPTEIVARTGIPPELAEVMLLRKLVYDVMAPYYLTLATFGIHMYTITPSKRVVRLVSDSYQMPETIPEDMPRLSM